MERHQNVTNQVWEHIKDLLPHQPARGGRWRDHRTVIEAVAWKYRTGAPGATCPAIRALADLLQPVPALGPGRNLGTASGPLSDRSRRRTRHRLAGQYRLHRCPRPPACRRRPTFAGGIRGARRPCHRAFSRQAHDEDSSGSRRTVPSPGPPGLSGTPARLAVLRGRHERHPSPPQRPWPSTLPPRAGECRLRLLLAYHPYLPPTPRDQGHEPRPGRGRMAG